MNISYVSNQQKNVMDSRHYDKGDAKVPKQITITLEGIEVDDANWTEFVKRLKESGQTLADYFSVCVGQEIECALFHDRRLLAVKTE